MGRARLPHVEVWHRLLAVSPPKIHVDQDGEVEILVSMRGPCKALFLGEKSDSKRVTRIVTFVVDVLWFSS